MSDNTNPIPSTPDPQKYVIWGGYARTLIAALLGMGIAVPIVITNMSAEQWSVFFSVIVPLLSAFGTFLVGLWSRWQKMRAAQLAHAGSVASSNSGRPLKVIN